MLAIPASASATITPRLALAPSTVTAGAAQQLGFDLTFSPSSLDYPKTLSLTLPSGLLVDLDGGACLSSATPLAGCELGTGTQTALVSGPVSLWLVKGPSASDVAGAALVLGGVVEATADVTLRTTPDVGLDVSFASLPAGVSTLDLILSSVRAPTSCPSTPATVGVSATSEMEPTAVETSAPLAVTGCGSLPYAPTLAAAVDRDASDSGATLTAIVIGPATESATHAFQVDIPPSVSPNVSAAIGCLLDTPCTIGAASASSPILPSSALSDGTVRLGGPITSPTLTVTFPAPYAISLIGTVNLSSEALTFNSIPDLPLTSLALQVGGASIPGLFTTTCAAGSLTAQLTPWDGGAQDTISTPITFGGSCPATPTTPTTPTATSGKPMVSGASLRGLVNRAAKLTFTVNEGKNAKPIKRITLALPKGIVFSSRKTNLAKGIYVRGSRAGKHKFSFTVSHGVLRITLSSAAAKAVVAVRTPALAVRTTLSKNVKSQLRRKKVTSLAFTVRLTDSAQRTNMLKLRLKPKS